MYRGIQSGAVAKSYMRKSFLIYEEFPIYEEAVSHILLCNCSTLNFLIYEENLIFFFISVLNTLPPLTLFHHPLPFATSSFLNFSNTVKKGIIKLFPSWESLVSDLPTGDGKFDNLFLQCRHAPSFI
jgi:hypothetical protein